MGEAGQFKDYEKRVARINAIEPEMELLEDHELREEADELRERARNGESLDDLLYEAFALCREAGRRTLGMRHFDVQLIGGMVLHDGSIAEMKTGEGKTLVGDAADLPQLARRRERPPRDGERLPRPPRRRLDEADLRHARREGRRDPEHAGLRGQAASPTPADVTYGTNSEFGFDYLRDNMAGSLEEVVQRGHPFGIVDEVDNILIDEARTPLIISGAPEEAADLYRQFARLAPHAQGRAEDGRQDEARQRRRASPTTTTSTTRSTRPSRPPSAASRRPRSSSASRTSTSPSTATSSTT